MYFFIHSTCIYINSTYNLEVDKNVVSVGGSTLDDDNTDDDDDDDCHVQW